MQKKLFLKPKKRGHPLKFLTSIFISATLFGNDSGPLYSSETANSFKQEEATATAGVYKSTTSNFTPSSGTSDVMIVDPKIVSKDWQDAFQSLKSKKLSDIIFVLRDHSNISDVTDVEALPGGYLMLFSLKTVQGQKYKIVKTSDISSITSK